MKKNHIIVKSIHFSLCSESKTFRPLSPLKIPEHASGSRYTYCRILSGFFFQQTVLNFKTGSERFLANETTVMIYLHVFKSLNRSERIQRRTGTDITGYYDEMFVGTARSFARGLHFFFNIKNNRFNRNKMVNTNIGYRQLLHSYTTRIQVFLVHYTYIGTKHSLGLFDYH